jgi:hypothetical protein
MPLTVRNSDFILIFFSKNSVAKRDYIQREFRLELDILEEMPSDAIHTIPIRLDDCQIPEQFRHLQWSDLSGLIRPNSRAKIRRPTLCRR